MTLDLSEIRKRVASGLRRRHASPYGPSGLDLAELYGQQKRAILAAQMKTPAPSLAELPPGELVARVHNQLMADGWHYRGFNEWESWNAIATVASPYVSFVRVTPHLRYELRYDAPNFWMSLKVLMRRFYLGNG